MQLLPEGDGADTNSTLMNTTTPKTNKKEAGKAEKAFQAQVASSFALMSEAACEQVHMQRDKAKRDEEEVQTKINGMIFGSSWNAEPICAQRDKIGSMRKQK